MKNENIFSGIYIKNIDVSNLSKDDATKKLNEYIQNYLPEEIILKHGDYETSINLSDLNIKFNINIYEVPNIKDMLDKGMLEENNEYIYIPSSWIYKSNEILVRLV